MEIRNRKRTTEVIIKDPSLLPLAIVPKEVLALPDLEIRVWFLDDGAGKTVSSVRSIGFPKGVRLLLNQVKESVRIQVKDGRKWRDLPSDFLQHQIAVVYLY